MSEPLNLFPSRIRFVNPDGTLTPEASRVFATLLDRVGGTIGMGSDEFALLAAFVPTDVRAPDAVSLFVAAPQSRSQAAPEFDALAPIWGGFTGRERDTDVRSSFVPIAYAPFDRPPKIGNLRPNEGNFTLATATTEFRRVALPTVAGMMLNQKDAALTNNGVQWTTGKVQMVIGSVVIGEYTAAGYSVTSGFGCNGAAPQAVFALGAAATDLASTTALANKLRTALINNGIGS